MSLTPVHDHRWDLCPAGARALQKRLASQAELRERLGPIALVAGLDVGFEVGGGVTRAAVAVLRAGDLQPAECRLARRPTAFPYVPGLLSFREIPAALDALAALRCVPDLLICDGQASPPPALRPCLSSRLAARRALDRRCQVAPAGRLRRPAAERGAWAPLIDRGEAVGAALRTRRGVKPVFVSPGHRVDVASAARLALAFTGRYRLPEPSRAAHRLASQGRAPGQPVAAAAGVNDALRFRSAPAPDGRSPPGACGS